MLGRVAGKARDGRRGGAVVFGPKIGRLAARMQEFAGIGRSSMQVMLP